MTPRTYAAPETFKQALEQRLRSSAKTGAEVLSSHSVSHSPATNVTGQMLDSDQR